ncbi:MAG: hypothetical protein Q9187_003485 [Circinaria calcarea]
MDHQEIAIKSVPSEGGKRILNEKPLLEPNEGKGGGKKGPKPKQQNGATDNAQVQGAEKVEKISNAELKKRAKAEKAARRVQEKQGKQQPAPTEAKGSKNSEVGPDSARRGSVASVPATPIAKGPPPSHHKPTGPIQKPLPLRQISSQAPTPAIQPKKDSKKVALFGHLYGQPRRTTIAAAGRDVHPAVLALGLQTSNYVICGSSARCVAMLLVFKRVIESYVTPPQNSLTRHLTSHLSPQIEYLVSCRPLSVSMGNAIRWLKLQISDVDPDTPESKAKADLCNAIDNFITERITVADQVIATSAAEKIQDGDIILTFAKSNVIQQTLVEAHRRGKKFRVIIVDSRPLFEGKRLARALADLDLEVQYSLTHAIGHAIKDATKVLLGAHAMMSNGRLYSRVGTAIVAMMAKESDVPVIVCCESIKFTDRVALDSIVTNEVAPPDELLFQGESATPLAAWRESPNLQLLNLMYDVTPAEYISMVITEYGSLPPSSVPVVHRLSTNT